jgi:hypothetical protein
MSFIDDTYFIRGLTVAQIGQGGGNQEALQMYITLYEPKFLQEVLGYGFYKLMMANIASPRFAALINGAEYTYENVLRKWGGFSNAEKESPVANYVFYQFGRRNVEHAVGLGVMLPVAENAQIMIPTLTLINAWNEMVTMVKNMNYYLKANAGTYPEYKEAETKCFHTINAFF